MTNYQLPSTNDQRSNGSQSLSVITNPSGDSVISAGETFELRVTIGNQGFQGAIIDLFIDDSSGVLKTWCPNPYERFALSGGSSSEVVFSFPIPVEAIPGQYTYLLVIDAPKHYPEETPIRHQATLQVLPPIQEAVQSNDPTFALTPVTSPEKPAPLELGQSLIVTVLVHNRSNRVDRFRLSCTDLPESWWEVHYPEGINELGLVVIPDNLALNPGAKGEVTLEFRFPPDTKAGRYLPTLRLMGENNPDLLLLDLVYIEVLPRYDLRYDLRTLVGKVSREAALFQLRLNNEGNTLRQLRLTIREDQERPVCVYELNPDRLKLDRGTQWQVDIDAKPGPWWRRPLLGEGRTLNFYLELTDDYQLPLPTDRIEGTFLWQARPWWQLLLAILAGLGVLGLLIFALWWLFFKPPAPPRIEDFNSVAPSYAAANDDFIYLNWEIGNARQIQSLQILGRSPNGNVTSIPVSYDLSRGLPESLQEFCTRSWRTLVCRNIRTDAREPGDYIFELKVTAKRSQVAPIIAKTNTIAIAPIPLPEILEFKATLAQPDAVQPGSVRAGSPAVSSSNQDLGEPAPTTGNSTGNDTTHTIELSWKISNPSAIAELGWIGRNPDGVVNSEEQRTDLQSGLPDEWRKYCSFDNQTLSCDGVPVTVDEFGRYIFELTVIPDSRIEGEARTALADVIEIKPPEPPKIIEFQPTQPSYEIARGEQIQLDWAIANPDQIQEIVLKGRSAQGFVAMPEMRFSFDSAQDKPFDSEQAIPEPLNPICEIFEQVNQLRCRNVTLPLSQSGDYQFELGVIPKGGSGEITQTETTATIALLPPPPPPSPQILQLRSGQPTYREDQGEEILLSWEIENAQQLQELRIIGRDTSGIARVPARRYRFDSGIPNALQPYCILAGRLICQNVPTSARQGGEYIFEVSTISQQNPSEVNDRQQTEVIEIVPRTYPLALTNFTVNGESAPLRVVVTLQPDERPNPLNLAWSVMGGPDTRVELLPSPGTVPLTGTLAYPISPQPGQETLTLTVTGGTGQKLQRTLVIETVLPPPSETPSSAPREQPLPAEPDGLSPADLPPQFD
ncbi:hypothetical protein PJF56_02015 [Roseofilum sp. BLCC_M91]|uniref:Alpha-galactosidase NEW3 domain-containing protein n=1 Tax=Roseofilum halophilum BLCC-M91 TaxID=3022259 RepID=A0ABT7BEL7_9CYAN|nr:hypothetical protein [Roseofilum halophilum]MDJ1177630.1 hypothetical protein [Roseofilum halophilum BLCC-M91]